ncbi:MAG: hypothetical protein CISAcid_05890 [uncultured Acidilobus sp. CIS]|nr:MAG: hypothetical protein CISAcid_05890 [uncultured Acidilobus sp. CIS]
MLGSIVSSEETVGTGSEEVEEAAAEETGREEGEASEELAPLEYKLGAPELIEVMLNAFDILERASEGQISLSEAKALLFEKVDEALKKAGEAVRKTSRRRSTKKASQKKKASTSRRKRGSKTSGKGGAEEQGSAS